MADQFTVAVVGVGAVGQEMVRILAQRRFPMRGLRLLARSARSVEIDGAPYLVDVADEAAFAGVDIALFAGTEGEKGAAVALAEGAIRRGAVVIDNGSDFRLDPRVPLVVPEVNAAALAGHRGLIANPNCSTVQLAHALKPLYDLSRIRRVIVSTYQAASGAGGAAARELQAQLRAVAGLEQMPPFEAIPRQLALNVLAGCWRFSENGYQDEEIKMVRETHKILGDEEIAISPTAVRVPVAVAHSEAIYLETESPIGVEQARAALARFPGIRVVDDPAPTEKDPHARSYPTPLDAVGSDETLVGRIRADLFAPNGLHLWCVADNLRKGAALNAVQIAEELIRRGLLSRR
jgi:aspartate-semialdehyde dehydrogenase